TAPFDAPLSGPPVAGDGVVVVPQGDRVLAFARDCTSQAGGTGAREWTADGTVSRMVVGGGAVVISTRGELRAYPIDCESDGGTGAPSWTTTAGPGGSVWQPVVAFDEVLVASGHHLDVFPLDCRADGGVCAPSAEGTTHGLIRSTPVVSAPLVYVGTGDSKVIAFDLT